MKIKITSDSTCDLSKELIEKYDIGILPLIVVKDGVEHRDGVDIVPDEIFAHVAAGGDLCSTAALGVIHYQEFFEQFTNEYDGVLHINIGANFSSCHQNATIASAEFDNVKAVDSMNLSTGQGLVVLKACELAQSCNSLDELYNEISEFTSRVEASFLLDQLKYMAKGGRCSSATALGANLLNLKPCIEVKNGKMGVVKKYRGNYAKCLASYVKDRLSNRDDLDHWTLFVTHTPVTPECEAAVAAAVAECDPFENTYWTEAGCTVSCHCGPATLGVLFVRK